MEYIIGSLAMLVAFVALLMASSSNSKIEEGNKQLKTQINADVEKTRKKLKEEIDDLKEKARASDAKMKTVLETQNQYKEAVIILEKKLAKALQELSA